MAEPFIKVTPGANAHGVNDVKNHRQALISSVRSGVNLIGKMNSFKDAEAPHALDLAAFATYFGVAEADAQRLYDETLSQTGNGNPSAQQWCDYVG